MLLKQNLQAVNKLIEENQPDRMDKLISLVNDSGLLSSYGVQFQIIGYMGSIQGVVIKVTGSKNNYYLPSKDKVYSIFKGLDKYFAAGWRLVPTEELI